MGAFDIEIRDTLEITYQAALALNKVQGSRYSPEQIKLMILVTTLTALSNTFLMADTEDEDIKLDMKKVALGVLGTADWVKEGLPQ